VRGAKTSYRETGPALAYCEDALLLKKDAGAGDEALVQVRLDAAASGRHLDRVDSEGGRDLFGLADASVGAH
jgi:hypothetical protein